MGVTPGAPPLRLAEAAGVLSLATDLAMGQPLEHGLRTAVLAQRTAQAIGLPEDDQVSSTRASRSHREFSPLSPPGGPA